jgi:hypothetical protein
MHSPRAQKHASMSAPSMSASCSFFVCVALGGFRRCPTRVPTRRLRTPADSQWSEGEAEQRARKEKRDSAQDTGTHTLALWPIVVACAWALRFSCGPTAWETQRRQAAAWLSAQPAR